MLALAQPLPSLPSPLACNAQIKENIAKLSRGTNLPEYSSPQEFSKIKLELLEGPICARATIITSRITSLLEMDLNKQVTAIPNHPIQLDLKGLFTEILRLAGNLDLTAYQAEKQRFPAYQFHRAMYGLYAVAAILDSNNESLWTKLNLSIENKWRNPVDLGDRDRDFFQFPLEIQSARQGLAIECAKLSKLLIPFCNPHVISTFGNGLDSALQALGFWIMLPSLKDYRSSGSAVCAQLKLWDEQGRAIPEQNGAWKHFLTALDKPASTKYDDSGFLASITVKLSKSS